MSAGEKYTAAAYLVVFLALLVYVLIIAAKLQRLEREVGEIVEALREREAVPPEAAPHEAAAAEAASADG
jgi:CcmD family protein